VRHILLIYRVFIKTRLIIPAPTKPSAEINSGDVRSSNEYCPNGPFEADFRSVPILCLKRAARSARISHLCGGASISSSPTSRSSQPNSTG